MDCIVPPQSALWTGALPQGLPSFHQRNYFPNFYFPQKGSFSSPFYPGPGLFFPHDDDVDYPTDMKGELTMSYHHGMAENMGDVKMCVVCGERASGFYFGALVCLPCKSFYIRCTKDGEPTFTCQCSGNCDIVKQGRIRCQYCRYQRCLMAGMCRKEKPETVQPAEGQVLCKVCGDIANGIHFGVNTCEGCKKFFRRGLVENQSYICKDKKDCGINPRNRNNCRYCRYQKCLGVGMSREAIKMGRPKKADGSDISSSMTSSPKMARQPLLEVDNQQNSTNPRLGEDNSNTDSLKSSSACNQIKKEVTGSSCDYEKKMGGMWNQGQGHQVSSWQQPCSQGQTMTNSSSIQSGSSQTPGVTSSQFIEEEMDEILMMLQNDNQSGGLAKKMRCYSNGDMVQRPCKSEFGSGMQGQWHMPEMVVNDQPMNMTTSHMINRPPPPYQGYNNNNGGNNFHQQHSPAMSSSPCESPNRQMPSPGGYMSDTSVHSPGYIPNGSPVHSPSCQYSPKHSPMYQNSPSPHSPYHSDASSQGSPYSEPMYHPHPYSPDNSYHVTDLSVNVNCGQQNMMTPGSPHQMSPPYLTTGHMTNQNNTTPPMTIPHQEGGGNSQDGWCLTGSPSFTCHSPSHHTNKTTIPTQESGYRRCSSRLENLQRINQHFITQPSHNLQLIPNSELDGSMTRSDIEGEIVHKTLASISPAESYYYVLSDSQSCSNDSGCSSGNYEEFTSCRRMNKRKILDDSDYSDSPRPDGAYVGRYKRHLSEKYWQASVDVEDAFPMTTEKQAILEHLNKIFQQMSDRCTESNKQSNSQDGASWQQIQFRIVRNTSAGVKFASQIPGFSMFHPEDKTFLCKTVTFMSAALMAGHNLYNPAENNFRDFWAWNIPTNNPFYPFKQHLVEIGKKIHATNMDSYEVATLSALLFLASDFTDLAYPEAVEEARRKIIAALKSYELSKCTNVKSRLSELFSLVPEIRHVGVWHHELMKQMKINVQLQEVHQLFDAVNYRES